MLLNGAHVKPSKDVHPSDTVEVQVGQTRSTVVVRAVADKRGSAAAAAALYEETPESVALPTRVDPARDVITVDHTRGWIFDPKAHPARTSTVAVHGHGEC